MGTIKSDGEHRKFFEMLSLLGPALFLEPLIPPERLRTDYLHFNERNSRNFVLLKILVEVQKAGIALVGWRESGLAAQAEEKEKTLDGYTRLVFESIVDEQSLWQRKLSEGLVLLMNFGGTNELAFYHHYLLIQELQRQIAKLREEEDFFGHASDSSKAKLDRLIRRIVSVESGIKDLKRCWYMTGRRPSQRRPSSFRKQLQRALGIGTQRERRALGFTYAKGFGETSGNIHFTALRPEDLNPHERFSVGFAFIGLLCLGILKRAHELAGVEPKGINRLATSSKDHTNGPDPMSGRAKVGDFVIVEGPRLATVEEVATGPYGYES